MIYYITHLKDVLGNNYLGIDIPKHVIEPFLNELKDIVGDDYDEFVKLKEDRDGANYHITVINVMDYNKLSKEMGVDKFVNSLDPIFKYPVDDLRLLGIGRAQRNENIAFFTVCQSDKLEAIRNRFELADHDFHITLGFKYKDVFGVRKNEIFKNL